MEGKNSTRLENWKSVLRGETEYVLCSGHLKPPDPGFDVIVVPVEEPVCAYRESTQLQLTEIKTQK